MSQRHPFDFHFEPLHIDQSRSHALNVYLEPKDLEFTNILERLGRFYHFHYSRNDIVHDLLHILNPEKGGVRFHPYDDVWHVQYHVGFHVLVIKHDRFISGPHAARLYYRSMQTQQLYWIATTQLVDVMFYNEPHILSLLQASIQDQLFYIAPHSQKDIIPK